MARKINPTDEERAILRKKNLERRSELYTLPPSKFNVDQKEMEEAEAPFSQVGSIINRFKNQSNNHLENNNHFDNLYSDDIISKLDNVTSSDNVHSDNNSALLDSGTSSDNANSSTLSNMELVTQNINNQTETSYDNVTSLPNDHANSPVYNKITDISLNFDNLGSNANATIDAKDTCSDNDRSNEYAETIHPLQKYQLINAIFTIDKDLSNVEKNFLVCLILEMKQISERLSINSFITKYDFRRATVYQIIPKISNLGYIQIITDNNPKGSQIDLSILFKRYSVSTVLDNVISSDLSLVRKLNKIDSNLILESSDTENVSIPIKLDATKRIMLKNAILFLFKSMMLLDIYRKLNQYNEKSIKLFSSYLLSNDVSDESQIDLLGLALYSSEKAKNPDKVIYYLHSTLENCGIESLQISFKNKAQEFLDFSNNFFEIDFEEPSLKDIREYSIKLGLDPNLNRSTLVILMNKVREEVNNNVIKIEKIIDSMPEFRKL